MKRIIRNLPIVKQILDLKREVFLLRNQADRQTRILQETFVLQLKNSPKYKDPRHLIHFEGQVYSQNGEDGILSEIFNRIGIHNNYFVEIGTSTGLENNTALLLLEGWTGLWVEGNVEANAKASSYWKNLISEGKLKVITSMVTAENIENLLETNNVPAEFDLFSLDIDQNTFHAFQKVVDYKPRVLILEYNGIFPVGSQWGTDYDASQTWDGTHRYGAALKKFEIEAKQKGYALVGCDSTGTNVFFVREDLLSEKFVGPYTSEFHFEPYRQFLVRGLPYPKESSKELSPS